MAMERVFEDLRREIVDDLTSIIISLSDVKEILSKGMEEFDTLGPSPVLRTIQIEQLNLGDLQHKYRDLLLEILRWEKNEGRRIMFVSEDV
jgi:hypothetical protein